jgi:hypothetical protein
MRNSALDLVLVGLLVPGAVFAWRTGQERSRLLAHYARLRPLVGDLPVGDPSKVYVLALPTAEPLHFAWRIHVPANYPGGLSILQGNGSSRSGLGGASSAPAGEWIARVRLRGDEHGRMKVYGRFSGGSMTSTVRDPGLSALLRAHARELRIEQLGAGDAAVIDPTPPVELLRIVVPAGVTAATTDEQPARDRAVVLRVQIGPNAPPTAH